MDKRTPGGGGSQMSTAIRSFFAFLCRLLHYTYTLLRNNRARAFIGLLVASLIPYMRVPRPGPEDAICQPCVDCPMSERTRVALHNMAMLTDWDTSINTWLRYIRQQVVNQKMTQDISFLTGSTVEGCSIAKWFHPQADKREIEADMQHIGGRLTRSDQRFVEAIPGKPDNLRIRLDDVMLRRVLHPKVLSLLPQDNGGQYINPQTFRKIGQQIARFRDKEFRDTKTLASMMFGLDIDKFEAELDEQAKERGAALTTTLRVKHVKTGLILQLSLDNVAAFRCDFWPAPADNFITRNSRRNPVQPPKWPSVDVRKSIVAGGCDIVPKPSPDGDVTTEWRWSFSRAEKILMDSLSANQKRSYFLAKIIFNARIKPIDSEVIHSYWAKTNMFWLCEDHPPQDDIWCDENLLDSVALFYIQFLQMIQNWTLPHFFIPQHSLLSPRIQGQVSAADGRTLQARIAAKMSAILRDVEQFTPSSGEFEDVYERLHGPKAIVEALASFSQGKPGTFKQKLDEMKPIYERRETEI